MRLKYLPDGTVYINQNYVSSYQDFIDTCNRLGVYIPFLEGDFCEYTESTFENITPDGKHKKKVAFQNIQITQIMEREVDFINDRNLKIEEKAKEAAASVPLNERIYSKYREVYSIDEQLDIIREKLIGKTDKFDKMVSDLDIIKFEEEEKNKDKGVKNAT